MNWHWHWQPEPPELPVPATPTGTRNPLRWQPRLAARLAETRNLPARGWQLALALAEETFE